MTIDEHGTARHSADANRPLHFYGDIHLKWEVEGEDMDYVCKDGQATMAGRTLLLRGTGKDQALPFEILMRCEQISDGRFLGHGKFLDGKHKELGEAKVNLRCTTTEEGLELCGDWVEPKGAFSEVWVIEADLVRI
jgi:hypothetical protein